MTTRDWQLVYGGFLIGAMVTSLAWMLVMMVITWRRRR